MPYRFNLYNAVFHLVFNCQTQCSLGFYFQALDAKQRAQPSLCSDDNLMGSTSQNLNNSTEVNVSLSAQLIQARPFIIVRILKFLHIIIIMVMVLVQARSILNHPCRHLSQVSPHYPHHHGNNLGIGKGRPSPGLLAAPPPHPWLHRCLQPWPGESHLGCCH